MAEVDPRFRQMGKTARRRRQRSFALRGLAGGTAVLVAGVLAWPYMQPGLSAILDRTGRDADQSLVQMESQFDIAPVVRRDTFTDIPGDPLIIPAPDDGGPRDLRQMPAPAVVASARRAPGGMVQVLDSRLVPQDRQLVAALPSTREEFALFQAERSRGALMNASFDPAAEAAGGVTVSGDQRPSSGVAFLRDAGTRSGLWRDLAVEVRRPTPPAELLRQNGFDTATAERLGQRISDQLSLEGDLPEGSVLALRYRLRSGLREVIQLSLYNREGFVGSLAMSQAGQLVPAADAWADGSLLDETMTGHKDAAGGVGQQRLLDLIYSAALRNDVPPQIIGEALSMMAKVHDLDSYADEDDRLTLIYAPGTPAAPSGAVLFVGISGPQGDRACYIVPAARDGFECLAPGARLRPRASGLDLTPPVAGVLSERFVPPSSGEGEGRGHVLWSAPEGSPVMAAGSGKVTLASIDPGKGTEVEITHPNGMVSRYRGLGALSASVVQDGQIAQGTVIGSVGGGARSGKTALIFQLLQDGTPIDPMPYLSGAEEVLASNAVEALIGRIIAVESAGNAHARNPLSTASGLGQFIEATWLRMMRSYRPDLVAKLSRPELLNLRFDPDLSRQMVRHLAQENEAFLRARGHSVSAGRLYLAHFLGPAGADLALRAEPSQSVGSVMGAAVVAANPFLRGYSIGDLRNWADRKMTGASAITAPDTLPAPPLSPELRAFIAAMDGLRTAKNG